MRFRQAWQVRLPDYSHGTLAHAGNRLLTVIAGERLSCYREDGTPAWSRPVDAYLTGSLPTARGSVYVDSSTILRVDIETGRVLAWRDVEPDCPYISLNEDEDQLRFSAQMPLRLFGLDLETLETRLEVQGHHDHFHPHRGMICESDPDGDISLRDPVSGHEAWHWQLPTPAGGLTGHFHYGDLYCRMSGVERIAIDVRSGQIQWREIEGDPDLHFWPNHHTFYKRVDATVYAGTDGLSAYDATTGALKWRLPVGRMTTMPAFDGPRACMATDDGAVHAVDLIAGSVLATHKLRSKHELRSKHSEVVLAGSRVYVKSFTDDQDAHELYGFDLIDD